MRYVLNRKLCEENYGFLRPRMSAEVNRALIDACENSKERKTFGTRSETSCLLPGNNNPSIIFSCRRLMIDVRGKLPVRNCGMNVTFVRDGNCVRIGSMHTGVCNLRA